METTLAPEVRRSRAQLEAAVTEFTPLRNGPDTAPDVAGALAALDWLLGRTPVAPILATDLPVAGNLSYEAARANIAADDFGLDPTKDPAVKAFARGADRILHWALRP